MKWKSPEETAASQQSKTLCGIIYWLAETLITHSLRCTKTVREACWEVIQREVFIFLPSEKGWIWVQICGADAELLLTVTNRPCGRRGSARWYSAGQPASDLTSFSCEQSCLSVPTSQSSSGLLLKVFTNGPAPAAATSTPAFDRCCCWEWETLSAGNGKIQCL